MGLITQHLSEWCSIQARRECQLEAARGVARERDGRIVMETDWRELAILSKCLYICVFVRLCTFLSESSLHSTRFQFTF